MSSLSELKEANPDMPDAQYGFHRDFVGAVAVGERRIRVFRYV